MNSIKSQYFKQKQQLTLTASLMTDTNKSCMLKYQPINVCLTEFKSNKDIKTPKITRITHQT